EVAGLGEGGGELRERGLDVVGRAGRRVEDGLERRGGVGVLGGGGLGVAEVGEDRQAAGIGVGVVGGGLAGLLGGLVEGVDRGGELLLEVVGVGGVGGGDEGLAGLAEGAV